MAQYSEEWFYPTGALATNQRAIVFGPGDDNVVASIFSDPAMTVPLANPTVTDANGVLTFYAADGTYWIWVGPTTGGNGIETTLGASPDNPVLSVNGIAPDGAGNVELTAADVGAQPIATIAALGDLYVGTGDNATTRLPRGADGEVLATNSAQPGGLEWIPAPGGAVDSVNGQTGVVVLTAADVGAQPIATIDTKGDLYAGTGDNATARRSVGPDGTVLTADSGDPTGMSWQTPASSGDVVGPASATDNALVRFDLTTGKLIQNSSVTLDDLGTLTLPGQASASVASAPGQLFYNLTNRCLSFDNNEPDVRLDIGQELWLEVRNVTGSTIANGAVVYITGTHASGLPTVGLAQANTAATALVIGIATHSIENNTNGFVTLHGVVHDVDTTAYSGGAPLYLSAVTPGALVTTPPASPNYAVRVGIVSKAAAANGSITIDAGQRNLGLGTANQVLGINAGATAEEYKTIQGTANVLTVTHGVGTITLDVDASVTDETIIFTDDRNVLTAGNGDARWYNRMGRDLVIVGAWASAGVAPTGADIIVDVNKNGTTIYSTQANRPTVPATTNGGAISATPNVTSFAVGDYLTVDIDQIGSTIAGGRLTIGIVVRQNI